MLRRSTCQMRQSIPRSQHYTCEHLLIWLRILHTIARGRAISGSWGISMHALRMLSVIVCRCTFTI